MREASSRPSPRSPTCRGRVQGQEEEDANEGMEGRRHRGGDAIEEEDEDVGQSRLEEPYVPPPPPPVRPTSARFNIEIETNFGDHLCLDRRPPAVGRLGPRDGVPMDWVEGNKWKVTVPLPAHSLIQYKYVIRQRLGGPDGETQVAGRSRRMLIATGAAHSSQIIKDDQAAVAQLGCDGHPSVKAVPAAVAAFEKVKAPEVWECSNKENVSELPKWANNAVFYQIFPLGYFGAPTVNDQKLPDGSQAETDPSITTSTFEELGIDAVYFSPVTVRERHARHDTFDYFQIDRRLGDVKLFKQIVKELHEIGIAVVWTGVFNHTGKGHQARRVRV